MRQLNVRLTIESYNVGVLAVFTALFLTQSQLNFKVEIERIERVVPQLAQATGMDLKFDPAVADDVVYVRARAVTASDLMKHVALAIDAEWVPTGSGFRLTRTDANMLECKRADALRHEKATAKLSAEIQRQYEVARSKPAQSPKQLVRELREFIGRQGTDGAEEFEISDKVDDVLASSPIGLAAFESFTNIGPDGLAKIPVGEFRTFSEEPRALGIQSKLVSAERLKQVDEFIKQCSLEANKQNLTIENEGWFMYKLYGRTALPPYLNAKTAKPTSERISRSLLRVLRLSDEEIEYQLLLLGASGKIIASHVQAISYDPDLKKGSIPVSKGDATKEVELTEVNRWIHKLPTYSGARSTGTPTGPEALKFVSLLADPVANEPLQLYGKGVLIPAAETVPGNIIVSLPASNPITVPSAVEVVSLADAKLEVNRCLEKQISGRWSVLRPRQRLIERSTQIRRAKLQEMYRDFQSGSIPDHAMQVKLAARYQENFFETFVSRPYQMLRKGKSMHQVWASPELVFLGSLREEEIERMEAGIPVSQLAPQSRAKLLHVLNQGQDFVEGNVLGPKSGWINSDLIYAQNLLSEATPSGLGAGNKIKVDIRDYNFSFTVNVGPGRRLSFSGSTAKPTYNNPN